MTNSKEGNERFLDQTDFLNLLFLAKPLRLKVEKLQSLNNKLQSGK